MKKNQFKIAVIIFLFGFAFFWMLPHEEQAVQKSDLLPLSKSNSNSNFNSKPELDSTPSSNSRQSENDVTAANRAAKQAKISRLVSECFTKMQDETIPDDLKKFEEEGYLESSFQNTNNLSSQLAYALISKNKNEQNGKPPKDQVSLLSELVHKYPDNQLVHYFLVSKCSEAKYPDSCDENIVLQATANDPNNGALWFQVAVLEAGENNITGVIKALEQVVAAPNYNGYWADSIEVFDHALESSGVRHETYRMMAAIGFSAALALGPVQDLFKFCREQSVARADIAQLCLDAGATLSTRARSAVTQSIGYGLQKTVYKALGDVENETLMTKLSRENMQAIESVTEASNLMMFGIDLQKYWFKQLKLFGEVEASIRLQEEVLRLSNDPDYSPCQT
ncbi:hypothetical protein [Aliikangiella coralliicola]|uniref:Uncharacterized protein n=1 Tax=Aliikangiella coralliicola TaxID=2592383 RepID=A0A545UJ94_9GAMM|nr:hypothetical protein [Aliikangiella coralliicola]TQV89532.1 hypothetical protein FLL46_01215 [Aliikangiella coralliicola]